MSECLLLSTISVTCAECGDELGYTIEIRDDKPTMVVELCEGCGDRIYYNGIDGLPQGAA